MEEQMSYKLLYYDITYNKYCTYITTSKEMLNSILDNPNKNVRLIKVIEIKE